jgi:WNK lysine deficient protein kinase
MCTSEGAEVLWHQITLSSSPIELLRIQGIDLASLCNIDHHNILRLRDAWFDEKTKIFHYITEFPPPRTLLAYIKEVVGHPSASVIARWSYQIISALEALHSVVPPIVHRAVTCENIFIDPGDGLIKLGLSGIEMVITGHKNSVNEDEIIDPKSDIWLFGLCVIEMSTGEKPYSEIVSDEVRRKAISEHQMPKAFGEVADPLVADLVMTCLSSLRMRPTAAQVKENSLFSQFHTDSKRDRPLEMGDTLLIVPPSISESPDFQVLVRRQNTEREDLLRRHEAQRLAYQQQKKPTSPGEALIQELLDGPK